MVPEFIYCKIVVIPGKTYDHKPYAIGYQKDSPYAEILDFHIGMMRERGTLDNIVSRYRGEPQQCEDPRFGIFVIQAHSARRQPCCDVVIVTARIKDNKCFAADVIIEIFKQAG